MQAHRLPDNPIISPATMGATPPIAENINGPSLIRTPDWLSGRLGRYHLYFAHHGGHFIRLAYADDLQGPWRIHDQGVLYLEQTPCAKHIASPDVHVDHTARRLRMYYHGPLPSEADDVDDLVRGYPLNGRQRSYCATSTDGLHFEHQTGPFAPSYFRAFEYGGMVYGLAMPGMFYRSPDGLANWEQGPRLFEDRMRHAAVRVVDGHWLEVYYTNAGDEPERILRSTIDLRPDWADWQTNPPETILRPEQDWEGADQPLEPSKRGAVRGPVHQLRDPGIHEEAGRVYLLYAVAGESGIAIAELR